MLFFLPVAVCKQNNEGNHQTPREKNHRYFPKRAVVWRILSLISEARMISLQKKIPTLLFFLFTYVC
jgi:hypothetical protein